MRAKPIFGKHQLVPGEQRVFTSDNFSLGVKRTKEGWVLLYQPDTENGPDFSEGEYFHTGKSNSLHIIPALPEKPLVFKGSRLHVSTGQKLTFFLTIPLSVQVYFSKVQQENLLKEYSVTRLSDTWFGEVFNGEPAFALGQDFTMSPEEKETTGMEAVCPVVIYNNSPGVLEVQRLIIRCENMTLHQNEGSIITSSLLVEYKGKDVISSASYHYSKIFHGEKPEILARPRNETSRNLLNINFHFIRNIYKHEL
jgi:hypothetical protein